MSSKNRNPSLIDYVDRVGPPGQMESYSNMLDEQRKLIMQSISIPSPLLIKSRERNKEIKEPVFDSALMGYFPKSKGDECSEKRK